MGIAVKCPHGHAFKVKDKYAGKKGLCPYCKGQVFVRVPNSEDESRLEQTVARAVSSQPRSPSLTDSSIFDDMPSSSSGSNVGSSGGSSPGSSASGSLIGSSAIRHNLRCPCGESVPMWFAKCPKCGEFMDHR